MLARLVFGLGGVNVGATALEVLGILGAGAAGARSIGGLPVDCFLPRCVIASRAALSLFRPRCVIASRASLDPGAS